MSIAQLAQRDLILFDLDGTLIDSAADLFRALNISLNSMQMPLVTEAQVRVWVGKGAAKLCEAALQHITGKVEALQHQQLLQKFMQVYAADLCVNTQIYPGVAEFLDYCQEQQLKMACVTNKPQHLAEGLLQQLKLSHYFQLVLGGDSLPQKKPHPLPLLHSVEVLHGHLHTTLMIGDSSNDVEAARQAGIDCIVVSYGYNHGEDIYCCQPQQVIDDLRELISTPQ